MLPKPAQCVGCPAYSLGKGYVPGEGPPNSAIALVGQGPGEVEAHLGQPFRGPSGSILDSMLAAAKIPRAECWVDNIVRCWLPGNRTPTAAERRYCWSTYGAPALTQLTSLRAIVPVGIPATKTVLGESATEKVVGSLQHVELNL